MSPKAAAKASLPRDPYAVLNVDRRASDAEIKRAYFRLVREYSPEHAPEQFQEIRAAYEQLRSPEARSQTDLFLLQPPPDLPRRRLPKLDQSLHPEDIITLALELGLADLSLHKDFHEPALPR
jgi:curved DNA-binding protein CbpA